MRLTLTVLLALSTSAAFAQAPQAPLNSPPAATLKGGKKLAPKWDAKAREIYKTAIETPTVAGRKDENLKLANYLAGELKAAGWAESDIHVLPYTSKPGVETAAIVARWPAAGTPKKKPMLIMGHMDVVEALPADWSTDPFKLFLRTRNGRRQRRRGPVVGRLAEAQGGRVQARPRHRCAVHGR